MYRHTHELFGMEHWADESLRAQSDQEALKVDHIKRTQIRFLWFLGGFIVILASSFLFEYIRYLASEEKSMRVWRILVGMVPGVTGLIAMLYISTGFMQDVYDILDHQRAFKHVWLLLFGRVPQAFSKLPRRERKQWASLLGLSEARTKPLAEYPHLLVKEGQIGESYQDMLLAKLGGPGIAIVFNDSAVVLEQYGRRIRVAGPGTIFLRRFERIREVLDLRPHERTSNVEALTKEGIPVETEVQVRFQLARDKNRPFPPPPGPPSPVYKWAWNKASQCHRLLTNLDEGWEVEGHWPTRVMGNVGSTLRALIADVELDKLIETYQPDRDPRRDLIEEYRGKLQEAALNFGAQILDVRVGPIKPTLPQVEKERIAHWKTFWKAKAQKEEAKGKAEAIRERGSARAYAQLEIIRALTREFKQVVEQNVALSAELIALRFIEALRQAWSRPDRAFISLEALDTLNRLQDTVKRNFPNAPEEDVSNP